MNTKPPANRKLAGRCALLLIFSLSFLPATLSQEAIRASMAGEAAAAAKRQAATTVGYYNLKIEDLRARFSAGLGIEASDNVNYSDQNAQSDVIVRPQIDGRFIYPITEHNALSLNLGAGYSAYVDHDNLSRFFITPGSETSFDIFVGDCLINLHDRFSIVQETYQNPATANSGDISTLDNASGISTTWDLNDLLLVGGYDFVLRRSTTSGFQEQNADTHALYLSGGFRLDSASLLRLDLGTSFISRETRSDGQQYHAGLSYQTKLSDYISVQAAAGYLLYQLDQPALAGGKDQVTGAYGSLGLTHRVNRIVSYTVDAGRDIQIGLFSDILDLYYARLQSNWNLVQKFSLSTRLSYEWGEETGGANDQLTRYGGGISIGRNITEKLRGSLGYDIMVRDSELAGRSYVQNRVLLQLNYAF